MRNVTQKKDYKMARNRMIKPETFESKTLSDISIEATYLFIGLWCYADDYGVYPFSHRQILGDIYKYRLNTSEQDSKKWLKELLDAGVIYKVEHNHKEFIIIKNWKEHQRVTNPSKRRYINEKDLNKIVSNKTLNSVSQESMGCKEKEKEKEEIERERVKAASTALPSVEEIFSYWNSKEKLPTAQITKSRLTKLKARVKENGFLENYQVVIDKLAASDFCTGENDRGWKANFDWLVKNDVNYVKVLEGQFDNTKRGETEQERFARLQREVEAGNIFGDEANG